MAFFGKIGKHVPVQMKISKWSQYDYVPLFTKEYSHILEIGLKLLHIKVGVLLGDKHICRNTHAYYHCLNVNINALS